MKFARGFTLSEVLVSLFITSILLTGLYQAYLSIKKQCIKNREHLEFNLDLQWISELIGHNIRQAGFSPCRRVDHLESADRRFQDVRLNILAFDMSSSESIEIHRMSSSFSEITDFVGIQQLFISGKRSVTPKHPIILADCFHAEVHFVNTIQKQGDGYLITLKEPLLFEYPLKTYIGNWLEEKWYLKRKANSHKGLYYKLFHPEELSSLVNEFRVVENIIQDRILINITLGKKNYELSTITYLVRSR